MKASCLKYFLLKIFEYSLQKPWLSLTPSRWSKCAKPQSWNPQIKPAVLGPAKTSVSWLAWDSGGGCWTQSGPQNTSDDTLWLDLCVGQPGQWPCSRIHTMMGVGGDHAQQGEWEGTGLRLGSFLWQSQVTLLHTNWTWPFIWGNGHVRCSLRSGLTWPCPFPSLSAAAAEAGSLASQMGTRV